MAQYENNALRRNEGHYSSLGSQNERGLGQIGEYSMGLKRNGSMPQSINIYSNNYKKKFSQPKLVTGGYSPYRPAIQN